MVTYPLLQSQLGVLLQSMQHPESTQYNLPNYIFMPLSMTRERVAIATHKLLASFPVLHTRFVIGEQGEIRQWCDESMTIPVVSRKTSEEELQAYLSDGFVRPFDLFGNEPLFRVEVIETEKCLCLLSDGHHAIVDGMSFAPILTSAFAKIYEGGTIEVPSYGMYQAAEDESASFGTEAYQRAKAYYALKFAGMEMATLSRGKTGVMGAMGRHTAVVSRQACDDWCSEHGVQANLLFQAAFSHVLSVLTRQQQVAYAAVNHGRMDRRLRSCVGMFVKSVPILVDADPACRIVDFVKSLRTELMSTIRHGIYPFTHFCSDLGMKPGIIFDFMAVADMEERVMLSDGEMCAVQPVRKEVDSDLSVDIYLRGESYEIRVQSSLAMNDAQTIQMVTEAVRVAVCNMMAHPEATLGELDIVSDEERDTLLQLGTGEYLDIDPQMTFVRAFEQRASQHPNRLAVADATESMTYGELSRRSNVLAHHLIDLGVKPGDFVAVMLPRTIYFPLAVIAIHKTGAAYVPIDLDYPEERKQYMLDHSQAKLVVDSQFLASLFTPAPQHPRTPVEAIDLSTPDGLAYMIYTSGSTGRPKGVMIRQASLWNFVQNFSHVTRMTAEDRVAAHRSFSFDAHLKDLYAVLTQGGSLHIMPEHIRRDLHAIRQFILDNRITVAGFTTTLGMLVLNTFHDLPIRLLNVGGERLHDVYSDHIVIVNCYGPTECTDDIFFYRIEPGERFHNVPIGRPVANGRCFLVDTQGRLVPRGAVGELCFAGVQVSVGYWQQPELTAEKFVDGMYHTGDLCKWNADGLMEYVRRMDDQVKLRGFRIEFGEVESCAVRYEGIREAVAVAKKLAGSDTLCLYYTASETDTTVDTGDLRHFMAQTLAEYMVPAAYTQLDALPRTPSGKVDRRQLPEPHFTPQSDYVAPETKAEETLARLMADVLSLSEPVSMTDSFFALGGDSIKLIRLVTMLHDEGFTAQISDLMLCTTVADMARMLNASTPAAIPQEPVNESQQHVYPLTPLQEGMLLTYLADPASTAYRLLFRLSLSMLPTETMLRHTLDYLAQKHEVLRTAILYDGVPQPCQAIVNRQPGLEMLDLTGESDIDAAAARIHQEQLHRHLSLTDDPLFRVVCMKTGDNSCQLLIFIHHIIADGWSKPIIFRDFLMKMEAEADGKPLTADNHQQGRYETFVRQLLRRDRKPALAYWKNLLAAYDTRAAIPSYGKPTKDESKSPVCHTLDKALTTSLRQLAATTGVTLNTVLELGWGLMLQSFCRTDDVVFLRVVSGRNSDTNDYSKLIGLCINSVPVRVRTAPTDTVAQSLKALQVQAAQSASYDFCPLSDIQEQTGLGSSLYQSVMAFENYPLDDTLLTAGHKWNIKPIQMEEEAFGELAVTIVPEPDGTLQLTFTYDASLYGEPQIQQVAETFETIVRNMAVLSDGQLMKLPLVTPTVQEELIRLGAGTHLDLDTDKTYMDYFLQRAATCPDALAVADATGTLTYSQLDRYSNLIAGRLLAAGVQPHDFVGVMTERIREFPVCVFGIHKAGAAYLPLDPAYPTDRLSYMLEDSGTRILITTHGVLDAKRYEDGLDVGDISVIYIDDIDWEGDAAKAEPVNRCTPDGYTYIIYTSGSTGRPKGAVLHQKGLLNYVFSTIDELGLTAADRISSHRSFSFDSHIEDLYPILLLGGSLHIMPESIRKDLRGIYEFIVAHQVTGGGYPTSVAKLLVNTFDLPLRYISAIGERLTGVVSRSCKIFNFYGPTECTDHISVHLLQQGREYENIPIGHVVANNWCFIVDTHNRLLPRGVAGELCIAGIQVGIGYWKRPELTAEKFTDCPFLPRTPAPPYPRTPMYHTGDLCRWNTDGELEYIGRMDDQVKLRGYRVELGEIEASATRFDGVSQAVAVIRSVNGIDALCLYYTVDQGATVDATFSEKELRLALSRSLAEYMVPTVYMQMDALPMTPNGKVDRRRLPAVDATQLLADYVAPESELERLIVSGFEKVLNQEKIGVNDDFVRLGGDSLDALKLVFSLGERGITVADVLSLRTPAAIASKAKGFSVNLNKYSLESGCPLNNSQMFIYNDIVKFNKYDSYLMPSIIPIDRKYTDEQIRNAMDVMFDAHPVLTMHVALRNGVPYMEKGDKPTVMRGSLNPLKILSLLTSGFDLYSSLSRHVIVRIPGKCYLVSVVHHLIFDVVSQNVFCRHFLRALEEGSLDFVDDHFLKVSAFHEEVKATEQYAETDKYIRAMLSNLSESNFYRNPGKHGRPGYHKRELGVDREQIDRFTDRFGINKNILFTAAMTMTLSKLAGSDEVAFGFLDNGRDRFNNFEDIGLYMNGMPIVAHMDSHDMQAFLDRLSDVYYKLSQNSYFPFASLAQEFNIAPIILFQFFPDWITEGGKYDHLPHNETLVNAVVSTQKDFMVEALANVFETGNGYTFRITYSGYYSRKMMKKLAKTYKETIIEMVKSEE